MNKITLLVFVFIVLCASSVRADMYDIDKTELECINNTSDTHIMNKCTYTAMVAWKNEINDALLNLRSINKENYKKIIRSQKYWEKYKDNEFRAIDAFCSNVDGTMYKNVSTGLKKDIVKRRAIQLNEYLNLY